MKYLSAARHTQFNCSRNVYVLAFFCYAAALTLLPAAACLLFERVVGDVNGDRYKSSCTQKRTSNRKSSVNVRSPEWADQSTSPSTMKWLKKIALFFQIEIVKPKKVRLQIAVHCQRSSLVSSIHGLLHKYSILIWHVHRAVKQCKGNVTTTPANKQKNDTNLESEWGNEWVQEKEKKNFVLA